MSNALRIGIPLGGPADIAGQQAYDAIVGAVEDDRCAATASLPAALKKHG
ncbi:MAG: hypothetical protein J0H94_14365 [Rhizobiales bacterium]|nr:hypothetical protein [Hyphomicrobiales bacterium]